MLYPGSEIVGAESVLAFGLHHLRVPQKQELERAPDGAGLHRLPEPVENEDGTIKMAYHTFPSNCRGS
jgi:hypothetical protein